MGSTVKDVMTTQVVAVMKAASFKEMAVKMRDSRIGAFPVVDDGGRVVGVVSAIAKCADTGTIGDGKIWVSPVERVLRVRTDERDNSAI